MVAVWNETATILPDGISYIIWRDRYDLEYLYLTGFVDTDKHSKDDWINAFEDSRRPDGSYRVTKDQWLAKKHFRYEGPVGFPLDPMMLQEGLWEMKDFEKLLKEGILPATTLTEDHFRKAIEKTKDTAIKDGKYVVNRVFKFGLKQLLLTYPSPRRVREMSVAEARKSSAVPPVAARTKAVPTVPDKSKFSQGPSKERQTADKLSDLLWKGRK